jgi:hypothetical protein
MSLTETSELSTLSLQPCRCREFPSLINCTTIDWFNAWPAEALASVSAKFLDGTDLGGPEVGEWGGGCTQQGGAGWGGG